MTVEVFLEKINYRKNNSWVNFGNDLAFELKRSNLTIAFDDDMDMLDDSLLEIIGRVYSKDNVAVPYTTIKLIETAKMAIQHVKNLTSTD